MYVFLDNFEDESPHLDPIGVGGLLHVSFFERKFLPASLISTCSHTLQISLKAAAKPPAFVFLQLAIKHISSEDTRFKNWWVFFYFAKQSLKFKSAHIWTLSHVKSRAKQLVYHLVSMFYHQKVHLVIYEPQCWSLEIYKEKLGYFLDSELRVVERPVFSMDLQKCCHTIGGFWEESEANVGNSLVP